MTTIHAQIPDLIYKQASNLAKKEKMSIEQIINIALAQALGAWSSQSIMAERAKRGDRKTYLTALAQVPDVEPAEHDKMK